MRKPLNSIVAALALGVVSVAAGQAETPEVLRVSAIPDENPQELLRIYKPFTEYLSKELGMPVKFVPVIDYAATVEGLAAKKLDLVWYGGFTSVQAVRRTGGQCHPPGDAGKGCDVQKRLHHPSGHRHHQAD